MTSTITKTVSIAITAFIAWIIVLAGFFAAANLPRLLFVPVHYLMEVSLFAIAFIVYFKGHPKASPFGVMAIAMASLGVFELVYFGYFYQGDLWFLTYVDWIVPVFLIASTIYSVGKMMKE